MQDWNNRCLNGDFFDFLSFDTLEFYFCLTTYPKTYVLLVPNYMN